MDVPDLLTTQQRLQLTIYQRDLSLLGRSLTDSCTETRRKPVADSDSWSSCSYRSQRAHRTTAVRRRGCFSAWCLSVRARSVQVRSQSGQKSQLGQKLIRAESELGQSWVRADQGRSQQARAGQNWARAGQSCVTAGSQLGQSWVTLGSELGDDWFGTGLELGQSWVTTG